MRLLPIESEQAFENSRYGKPTKIRIDAGPCYAGLVVIAKNVEEAQLVRVNMTNQNDPRINCPASFFIDREKFLDSRIAHSDGVVLFIPFANFEAETEAGLFMDAYQTLPGENIQLSIELGAATQAQIDNNLSPELELHPIYAPLKVHEGQLIRTRSVKYYDEAIVINKTNENSFLNPDLSPATNPKIPTVHGIHILEGDNTISKLEINQTGASGRPDRKLKATPAHNNWLLKQNGFVPQAGYVHIVPAYSKYVYADSLDVADGAIEIRPTVDTTDNLTAIYHLVERTA